MKIQCLHSEIPESTCMISLHGFKTSFNTSVTAVPLLLPAKHFHGFSKVSGQLETSIYAGYSDVLICRIPNCSNWVSLFVLLW